MVAAEIVEDTNLTGKNFIVTGGYSGIGIESVKALLSAGANVIVPARNRTKAETTLKNLVGNIEIADMNLGDLNSVRKFAEEYTDTGRDLYALINNAAINVGNVLFTCSPFKYKKAGDVIPAATLQP